MKKLERRANDKLRLSRETLRSLTQSDLGLVNGGITTLSCEFGSCNTCNTRTACTSRLC